jgi:transposase
VLLQRLHDHFVYLDEQIKQLDKELADNDLGRRLLSTPCVGPLTASLLAVEIGDGQQYGCSRDFAASLGLVPRQYSRWLSQLVGYQQAGRQEPATPVSAIICGIWSSRRARWQTG